MAQKTNPISLRLGLNREFDSIWKSSLFYSDLFVRDLMVREYFKKFFLQGKAKKRANLLRLGQIASSLDFQVFIYILKFRSQRKSKRPFETIPSFHLSSLTTPTLNQKQHLLRLSALYLSLTGSLPKKNQVLAWRNENQSSFSDLEKRLSGCLQSPCRLNIVQSQSIYSSAESLAFDIKDKLEKRRSYRGLLRRIQDDIDKGLKVKGIRILLKGRLNGAELARRELRQFGQISLHVFDAQVDYSSMAALTPSGKIGIKVWISY